MKQYLCMLLISFWVMPDVQAQSRIIKGNVTGANDNQALPGVSVVIKGTQKGTITNAEGIYQLEVSDANTVLVFSYVGYQPQEIAAGNKTEVSVSLAFENKSLDEVVVVGYGTQSQRNVTGAVQTVKVAELADVPVPQLSQKLQGRLAGVQILQTTGRPGGGMSVRIRGQASVSAGNQPLYVVDGFPITGDISTLNPDEIESISVLKDAASTSLYGSRASNGVVMITTKRAKNGETRIALNAYYGIQQLPSRGVPDMMDASEFAQFMKELNEENKRTVPIEYQNPAQYGKGTDWYKLITRSAPIQNYSVSIGTGGEKFTTNAVLGYFQQDGVIINTKFKRFSVRLNSDYRFNKKVRIGINVAPSVSIFTGRPTDGGPFSSTSGLITSALLSSPIAPAVNPDGSLPVTAVSPGMLQTPNWYRVAKEADATDNNTRVLSTAFLEYVPVAGLTLKTSLNAEYGQVRFNNFVPSTSGNVNVAMPRASGDLTQTNTQFLTWLSENIATYEKDFTDHHLDVTAGFTAQKFRSDMNNVLATNFPNDKVRTLSAATAFTPTSEIQEWSLLSYLARVNYNFKGKYLLSASIRRDGSSRFGKDNKWGSFPSVSAGWVISDESFMADVRPVSLLKIRSSYGVTGNNNIGNYTYYANVGATGSNGTNNYVFDGKLAAGNNVTTLSNSTLGWEITHQFDFGIDLGLFNNRLSFAYDYYTKKTDGLLFNVQVPTYTGFSNFQTNIGTFKFWGHEFTISSKNLNKGLKWNTDFNISFLKNRVEKLGTANAFLGGGTNRNITMVGQPIGMLWGYVNNGVYMNQEDYNNSPKFQTSNVGTVKMKDVNNDGVVTVDDRAIIGNPNPDFIFGVSNNFVYRNFDLNIVAAGSVGNDIMNTALEYTNNLDGVFNVAKSVAGRWRSEQDPGDGIHPRTLAGTTGLFRNSNSLWVTSGSYLTIKNIAFGYTFPVNTIKNVKILRLYASVQQAFVFTKYKGSNPEVNSGGENPLSQGIDVGAYPVPRTFTFGFNVGF